MTRAGGVLIVVLTDAVPAMGLGRRKGDAMHAQVVTFGLNGITEEQFREAAGADAPTFANLPGLLAKMAPGPRDQHLWRSVPVGRPRGLRALHQGARSSMRSRPTRT